MIACEAYVPYAEEFIVRQSVLDNFVRITETHEGTVPWPYLDIKGYVTTGTGNLIENIATGRPTERFFEMAWERPDGSKPSRAYLQNAWDTVKGHQEMASYGGGSQAFAALTDIRLGPYNTQVNQMTPAIREIIKWQLDSDEALHRAQFPQYDSWPADAQLALAEMSWAKGADYSGWPGLRGALNSMPPNFAKAAIESHISNAVPARNEMDRLLFENAQAVIDTNADPEPLYYPGTVSNPAARPTVPDGLISRLTGGATGTTSKSASASILGSGAKANFSTPAKVIVFAGTSALCYVAWKYFISRHI